MSLTAYDLLPVQHNLDLPEPVSDALLDMGTACNTAAMALNQATLLEANAHTIGEAATANRHRARHTQDLARHLTLCALSYTEQLTVVYALTASGYATYAVQVAADLLAGRNPAPPGGHVLPSQILADPNRYTPLVQLPSSRLAGTLLTDQNTELSIQYHALIGTIDKRMLDTHVTRYDDPAVIAHRPATALDLVVDFPTALHRYAAALAWTIGLLTSKPATPATD